jgi:hypothetical protein
VVLALPYHNAAALHDVPRPRQTNPGTVLAVRGERKSPYRGRPFILFDPQETGVAVIWRQRSGEDLVVATCDQPSLARFYVAPTVWDAVTWKTAIVVSGADWAPLELEPDLYLVGDHNIPGLEDSYLTGLCAANRILSRSASPAQPR